MERDTPGNPRGPANIAAGAGDTHIAVGAADCPERSQQRSPLLRLVLLGGLSGVGEPVHATLVVAVLVVAAAAKCREGRLVSVVQECV